MYDVNARVLLFLFYFTIERIYEECGRLYEENATYFPRKWCILRRKIIIFRAYTLTVCVRSKNEREICLGIGRLSERVLEMRFCK